MIHRMIARLLMHVRGDTEPGPRKRRVGSWMLRNVPGMLTCAEFEAFIHDYYENDVSAETRRRFDTHMELCPMCSAHFRSYVRAIALGQEVCEDDDRLPEDLPEELLGAILLAVHEEPHD